MDKMNRRMFVARLATLSVASLFGSVASGLILRTIGETQWIPPSLDGLAPGSTIDLSATLPASVRRGGVFSVHAQGATLPEGVILTREGMLVVNSLAACQAQGVVFCYEEPR